MYPYLSAELAAAHAADLMREAAAARCCSVAARHPIADRLRATLRRAATALHGTPTRTTPVCCPA